MSFESRVIIYEETYLDNADLFMTRLIGFGGHMRREP